MTTRRPEGELPSRNIDASHVMFDSAFDERVGGAGVRDEPSARIGRAAAGASLGVTRARVAASGGVNRV